MNTPPTDLRSMIRVRAADVVKAGRLAGQLVRGDGSVAFIYAGDYLEATGPPVATTLPLREEPYVTRAGAVPPFFAGLLPEGRRLSGLRRAVKTSADDELSLLLAVGQDPVGDVQIVPAGHRVSTPEPLVTVDRSFDEIRFSEILEKSGVVDPVALAGVQDKASARMVSVPLAQAGRRYILKIDPPEYPHLVANEAFFLTHARRARIRTARTRVVLDSTGRPGLLVERFGRQALPDGTTKALAVEDAAQLLGIYPADKYAVTAEQLTQAVAAVCSASLVAVRDVFRQLCYAWLTGNGDVHAKNIAVLASTPGEWQVAPAYDLLSTLPYGDNTLALPVGGRNAGLSRKSLLAFAAAVGLPERAAERTLDDVHKATESIPAELEDGALPLAPHAVRSMARVLRQRWRVTG